jgi:hypothetical protein
MKHLAKVSGPFASARPAAWMVVVTVAALGGQARADNLLRGPYPFLHDNELSVHGGYAVGLGDTFAGPKATVDYGYRLTGGLWLDVGVGFLSSLCSRRAPAGACAREGDAAEVLAGIKWKLRMNVPVVPYAKLVAGLTYLFPREARSGLGPVARGGIGAHYFFYEWIGVGVELTAARGYAGYEAAVALSRTVGAFDAVVGAELPF